MVGPFGASQVLAIMRSWNGVCLRAGDSAGGVGGAASSPPMAWRASNATDGPLPPARCDLELTGVGGASRVLAIMRS